MKKKAKQNRIFRTEKCQSNSGTPFRISPCIKNENLFSVSGGCFYRQQTSTTLLNPKRNCNCLHLINGYPPDPMQVVAFLFFKKESDSWSVDKHIKEKAKCRVRDEIF
ncbi:MAG: hypothetical protein D6734_06105 [Candidatus Schekmanbacteria bacterium]|nr:MAG: hypothetical protein D6734_06105 [Candidatus Schekmanbacteria bacterium]